MYYEPLDPECDIEDIFGRPLMVDRYPLPPRWDRSEVGKLIRWD
jgi:hypothetical protein